MGESFVQRHVATRSRRLGHLKHRTDQWNLIKLAQLVHRSCNMFPQSFCTKVRQHSHVCTWTIKFLNNSLRRSESSWATEQRCVVCRAISPKNCAFHFAQNLLEDSVSEMMTWPYQGQPTLTDNQQSGDSAAYMAFANMCDYSLDGKQFETGCCSNNNDAYNTSNHMIFTEEQFPAYYVPSHSQLCTSSTVSVSIRQKKR